MPLPLPDLDTRTWTDLVEEARTLIPRYAPGWTDHNVHDPGITLVELLAWLVELDVYRLNQIPTAHQRKFLALVGQSPAAARPAHTWFGVTPPAPVDVAQGTVFVAVTPNGAQVPFRVDVASHCEPLGLVMASAPAENSVPLMLIFDTPLPVDQVVRFAFALAGGRDSAQERARIAAEPGLSVTAHHSVDLVWEISAGDGAWLGLDPARDQVRDDTRALTLDGLVEVRVPLAMSPLGTSRDARYGLRARIASGEYDTSVQVSAIVVNAVPVTQVTALHDVQVGTGTGLPAQRQPLPLGDVVGGSLQVTTIENGEPREWSQRSDFDASSPADRHVVLASDNSSLIFGDGNNGRIPPAGAQIRVTYQATLGKAGNQPAGLQLRLAPSSALSDQLGVLSSPLPATGGEDAETLQHAAGRAVAELQTPTRAITAADYEWLALRTPGAALARARALAGHYEPYAGLAAPGVVTLIIVPDQSGPRPRPSAGLLRSVRRYLDRRRILGTHVEVVGPSYLEVQVTARVRARQGADPAAVQVQVLAALNHFFDPLHGGADSTGWPFGRAVYRAEVLQVIDAVEGVDTVLSLDLSADGQPAQCGNLCLGATQLTASGAHVLQVSRA